MSETIALTSDPIDKLDLSPATKVIQPWLAAGAIAKHEQSVRFAINYPQPAEEAMELSEIPEVRLWFVRLDTLYPWMPFLLDWQAGELARYAAMLVPHQFSEKEGIQYNPQALDIFIMHKIFLMDAWLKSQGIAGESKLKNMAKMFGYDLDTELFKLLQAI
jgi:hypothetical protein